MKARNLALEIRHVPGDSILIIRRKMSLGFVSVKKDVALATGVALSISPFEAFVLAFAAQTPEESK